MSKLATARFNMVESQIRTNDITDVRILSAMRDLPREAFLPSSMRDIAYIDEDIALTSNSEGQPTRYLTSPLCFSKMLQVADINPGDLVLDIGCGTGYSTAVLSRLAESVVGLECDEKLAAQAEKNLQSLGVDNAAIVTGTLEEGYASEGPYDVIILEGSVKYIPDTLLEQLKDGGRLIAVIGDEGLGKLRSYNRINGEASNLSIDEVGMAPLPGFALPQSFVF